MSKTKGTGVDPLELTQKFGTDALRYMLVSMSAPGTDIILSEDRILGARAFANKIWNAARFLFMNLEKAEAATGITLEELAAPEIRANAPYAIPGEDGLIHRWIFARLAAVSEQASRALQDFRFHEASQAIYQFFWGDFCDWYIEWVKPQLASSDRAVAVAAWRNIFAALEAALRLLHPIMPFLTEELWHRLPQPAGARSIALDKFPEPRSNWIDAASRKRIRNLAGNHHRGAQHSRRNENRSEAQDSRGLFQQRFRDPQARRTECRTARAPGHALGSEYFVRPPGWRGRGRPLHVTIRPAHCLRRRYRQRRRDRAPAKRDRPLGERHRVEERPPGRRNLPEQSPRENRRRPEGHLAGREIEHQKLQDRLKQLE